jgi:CRP-like cAMP-binding protein
MTPPDRYYPQKRYVVIAGILTLGGIATGLIYVQNSTPNTMVLFLGGGSMMFMGGIALFLYAQLRDVRSRLESFETRQFKEGDVIYHQSDPAEHFFVVSKGEVEFTRKEPDGDEVVLGRLGPEDHFGEFGVLGNLPYQATARAVTHVEVVSVHRADFERMYTNLTSFRKRIDAEVSRRRGLLK